MYDVFGKYDVKIVVECKTEEDGNVFTSTEEIPMLDKVDVVSLCVFFEVMSNSAYELSDILKQRAKAKADKLLETIAKWKPSLR